MKAFKLIQQNQKTILFGILLLVILLVVFQNYQNNSQLKALEANAQADQEGFCGSCSLA